MNAREREGLAAAALQAARQGAAHAMIGYRKPKTVMHKGAIDLVTEFDTGAEHVIREALASLTPDIPVVAEEEGGNDTQERTWFVDPIDGTTNYAHGHPFWCVSVGLVTSEGPVLGAVVAPALQIEWVTDGALATRNVEQCRVSEHQELSQSMLATGLSFVGSSEKTSRSRCSWHRTWVRYAPITPSSSRC